ncbi:MAG: GIY-YIG nuclease family protein [Candidatus Thiodiazotropha sp. (ex Dulcina madagascariensis)]|nr:GIY-YIG nuclease family protein [Candidatus Thiodiazotropha sp. (ex Dulcina madagascariensis)]MCU7925925.1 GIY-YIG nuclease family protein [Candidatus Thiodiazotropha sp. (ex Dulcina madagascariensis)]
MKKEHILSEIKRTAAESDGIPLGIDRFREATGIRKEDWYGIFWTKWSDAQIEAGLNPNKFSLPAFDEEWMVQKVIECIRELGHFPTQPEFKIKRRNDSEFPNPTTLRNRLGNKLDKVEKVLLYCEANDGYEDVIEICVPLRANLKKNEKSVESESDKNDIIGHVYLLKHGSEYKIGKSMDASRRYKQIKVQMPLKTEEVHVIETDDPSGIEAYWHNRFKDKRLEGEWFKLTAHDVKIFKKRKFM